MEGTNNQILFGLLRCAIRGVTLTEQERACLTSEALSRLYRLAKDHDVEHLLALGLMKNGFKGSDILNKSIYTAIYRAVQRERELACVKAALGGAQIPFIPLKGAVLSRYYPESYMRTSCDVDVLVHREELESAIAALCEAGYREGDRAAHDVSLFSPEGNHVELHFDLVEEGRASHAAEVLHAVWDHATPEEGYCYALSDAFFYFYHVAHMAKHFETGGCGIRPFVDLFILDGREGINVADVDALLEKGGLVRFANAARALAAVWLGDRAHDAVTRALEGFILSGGVYGTADNRVLIQQKKRGGKLGYLLSRIFVPFDKLKRYYPILEKHPWLMPVMQVRRWFMLLDPRVAQMARREMKTNKSLDGAKATDMQVLMDHLGL